MDIPASEILAKLYSLGILRPEDWFSGPYSSDRIEAAEGALGRLLDNEHKLLLQTAGGNFTFETGAVDVGTGELNVCVFFGLGAPYDIVDWWDGYRGQIPLRSYPFAGDSEGHIYCLSERHSVYHVVLEEELLDKITRPEDSGQQVADTFGEFVMSLQLPEWAISYFKERDHGPEE